jgi:caspase domain-containing protein
MRKSLVVGINDYPRAPLQGCVNDANAMAGILGTHGDGSPNFEVKLMTSPGDTITKAKLKSSIESLFSGDSDIALLYFSGHGLINSLGGYIVTTDFERYDEGVSMDDILNFANHSRAKDKVILLDCCHSGMFGSPKITGSNVAQLSEGLSVLTASRDSESALEINGRGVFTALVVSALQGGAADLRGHITPGSTYAYVDQALGAWDQRLIFKTNVTRFTSLRTIPPPVPHATLRKIVDYFPSPQDEHPLDPSYEFTSRTHDDAKVAIFKDLQKFESVGLVVPVGEEHMYFAAMKSKSCRLTALGFQYWRLVKEKRL